MQQLVFTTRCTVTTLLVLGAVFVVMGVLSLEWQAQSVVTQFVYYDHAGEAPCQSELGVCSFEFEVEKEIPGPVHMYYSLTNFYQNHRRFINSREDRQLRGTFGDAYGDTDMGFPGCDLYEVDREVDGVKVFHYPCGLVAKSIFNDTFSLSTAAGDAVPWRADGIAWDASKHGMFQVKSEEWHREHCYSLGGHDFEHSGFGEEYRGFNGTGDAKRSRFALRPNP